jgi:hypothetical protein
MATYLNYSGDLTSDLKKVIKEWKKIIKSTVHIGKAQTIGVTPLLTPQQWGRMIALLCRKFI